MKSFNLVKSLTRVINNRKGLLILCLSLAVLGVNEAWGTNGYWAKAKTTISSSSPTGSGKIYENLVQYSSGGEKQDTDNDGYAGGANKSQATINFSFTAATPNDGYSFKGWATSDGSTSVESGSNQTGWTCGVQTASRKGEGNANKKTFYAVFTANTYTVTFDAGANSTASSASKSVTFDSPYGDLATTTRAGLEGWYTGKTDGSKVGTTTTVATADNHTLYARYNYYAKATSLAVSNVEGDAGGGTYISINGGTPSGSGNYKETEDSSVKTIVSYNENPTTASYFAAQAKTGFKFMGWYSDKEHTQLVSSDEVYQPTITVKSNNSNSPTTLSLYAYFEVQWPTYYGKAFSYSVESKKGYTWISMRGTTFDGNFTSDVSDNSHQEGKYAAAPTFPCVFYAGPKDGYAFAGWYDNAECTGTPLSTSTVNWCNYNENLVATSTEENNPTTIHRYAKFAPVTVSAATTQTVNFTARTETKTATLTFPVTNADAKADFYDPGVTSGDAGWTITGWNYANNAVTVTLSFTATENTTTRGEHTATVTLTAKSNNSATGTVTANVQMTPTYTCTIADTYLVDDNAIDLNTLWTSTSNGTKHYFLVSFTESGINNDGATKPALNGTTLSLGQAGTVKLKLTQDAGTSSVAGTEQTKTITISKRDNTLYANNSTSFNPTIVMDATQDVSLTATNMDYSGSPITATQTEGTTIAVLNAAQNQVTSNHNLGTATWSLSQPENYKYKAGSGSFSVTVAKAGEATDCYVLNEPAEWKGNYSESTEYNLTGPGKVLTLNVWKTEAATYGLYVKQYVGDSEVKTIEYNNSALTTSPVEKTITLEDNVTKIVVQSTGGTLNKHCSNVRVTRKTYLEAPAAVLTTATRPNEEVKGELVVNWSCANGGDLKIANDNSKFTLSQTKITDVDCKTGSTKIAITYSSAEVGDDVAHLVIYNDVYRTETTITGKTEKLTPVITWTPDEETFNKGDELIAESNSTGEVTLSVAAEQASYVTIDGNKLTITGVPETNDGKLTITATVAEDENYNSTSEDKTITVTNKIKQYITWNQSFGNIKTTDADITLAASVESGLLCRYTCDDTNGAVVKLLHEGDTWTLQIVGEGEANITAYQDGNDEYAAASSVTKHVLVFDPTKPCPTGGTLLSGTETVKNGDSRFYSVMCPKSLTFSERSSSGLVAVNLFVYQKVNGAWKQLYEQKNRSTSYKQFTLTAADGLDINATEIEFRTSANYGHDITGVSYVRETHATPNAEDSYTMTALPGQTDTKTFTIDYSNVRLLLSLDNDENTAFSVSPTTVGDCGMPGVETVTITYAPKQGGSETNTLYIKKHTGEEVKSIALSGTATKISQQITKTSLENKTSFNTTDSYELKPEADSKLTEFVYTASPEGVAEFDDNVMTFKKSCDNLSITITQPGNTSYEPCSTTVSNIKVNKVTPTIITLPTAGDITYGAASNTSVLSGGAAKDDKGNAVDGSFAWEESETKPTGGTHSYTVRFKPTKTDWYNDAVSTDKVTLTVNKANQTIIWETATNISLYTPSTDVLNATTTGDGSIVYTIDPSSGDGVGTITNNVLTLHKSGTLVINANAAATTNFNAATQVQKTFEVDKRSLTIAWEDKEEGLDDVITTYAAGSGDIGNHFVARDAQTKEVVDILITITQSSNEDAISIQNNKLYVDCAGQATITATTAATDQYGAGSGTVTLTSQINTPVFTWQIPQPAPNSTYTNFFTSTNEDSDCKLTFSSNSELVKIEGGKLIVGGNDQTDAEVKITVKQPGNCRWEAHEETFTIRVKKPANHVPFTIDSESKYKEFKRGGEGNVSWANDGMKIANGAGGWGDNNTAIIAFTGIPDKLSFSYFCTDIFIVATQPGWWVKESEDGVNWPEEKLWNETSSSESGQQAPALSLKPQTRYLMFCYSGNFSGVFKNINVTELKYFYVAPEKTATEQVTSIDMSTYSGTGEFPVKRTIYLRHANAGSDLQITIGDTKNFRLEYNISTGTDQMGDDPITIIYEPDDFGTHNTTLTIHDGQNSDIIIPVTAAAQPGATYTFIGTDGNAKNLNNWQVGGITPVSLPNAYHTVIVQQPMVISAEMSFYYLDINTSSYPNAKVIIAPTGGLTIGQQGVRDATIDNLIIQSSIEPGKEGQGYLRVSPKYTGVMPQATVQLATRSTLDNGANKDATWQYIGIPTATQDFTVDYITWWYKWDEAQGWVDYKDKSDKEGSVTLNAWEGYAVTQYGQPTYEWKGQLLREDKTIELTCTTTGSGMNGDNLFANSYSSPIDVKRFTEDDFEGTLDKTFYIFNSGSWNQWNDNKGNMVQSGTMKSTNPGQYIGIPVFSAAYLEDNNNLTMIAPMQGVYVYTETGGAKIKLNYTKHVWQASSTKGEMNLPLRAPQDNGNIDALVSEEMRMRDSIARVDREKCEALSHRIRISATSENSGADFLYVLEEENFTHGYDNGYEAPKIMADAEGVLNIYTNEAEAGLMSVAATNDVNEMFVGFNAGEDYNYELFVTSVIGDDLELMDMQTGDRFALRDGASYEFAATPNSEDPYRFRIFKSETKPIVPTGWTGLGDKAKIWYNKQVIYISDASANSTAAIYTAAGELLEQVTFNHNTTISTTDIPEGVYTVRVEDSVLKFFVKH